MKKIIISLTGGLLSLIWTGACTVDDTELIIENAVEAQENLDSYYAEVTTSYEFENEQETMVYKEWNVKPDKHRMEMRDGHTYVSNGEQAWSYDKDTNTVIKYDESGDFDDDMPDESEMMREMLTNMMESNEVVAEGTSVVAGRDTIHLSLTPKDASASPAAGSYEIWVDEETYMPLKMSWEGDDFSSETVYNEIEYNIEIDESLFTFDIPEGAEVHSADDYAAPPLTLDELEDKVDYDLPEVSYKPGGYSFHQAMYFNHEEESMIEFSNSNGGYMILTISKVTREAVEDEDHELVDVGRYLGSYSEMHGTQSLSWNTGKFQFDLTALGDDLSKDEFIKTAEGIE